jgi:hypothetical protein
MLGEKIEKRQAEPGSCRTQYWGSKGWKGRGSMDMDVNSGTIETQVRRNGGKKDKTQQTNNLCRQCKDVDITFEIR